MNERLLAVAVVTATLAFGLWRAVCDTKETPPSASAPRFTPPCTASNAPQSTKTYLTDVIVNGSSRLHYKPTETMPPGLATGDDARNVAHYVLRLRGEAHDPAAAAKGALLYSSNCAGCHGDDGKGLGGTYPDLTRKPLLGMER